MSDFQQAIKWLKEGKKVRRKSWENKDYHYVRIGDLIYIMSGERSLTDNLINMEGDDWEIHEEEYYECDNCGRGLEESDMGKKCKFCGVWTYHNECVRRGKKEEKLKTLKDIGGCVDCRNQSYTGEKGEFNEKGSATCCVDREDLRIEAIKRWKHFKKRYMDENEKGTRVHLWGRMEEIKEMNNLTEEELK